MHACKQGEEDSVRRTWNEVDQYLTDLLVPPEPALDAALAAIAAANLPAQSVSPLQGKLLHLLARISRARQILEIGTLGGYSAIWLARALPSGGRLITLERNPRHAARSGSRSLHATAVPGGAWLQAAVRYLHAPTRTATLPS